MSNVFLTILISVIGIVAIVVTWKKARYRPIMLDVLIGVYRSLARMLVESWLIVLQYVAGRRIKRPFMSADTLAAIEEECKIIPPRKAYHPGGVTRHRSGPPPARSPAQGFTVTSMGGIDTIKESAERIASEIIHQQRKMRHDRY